MKISPLDIRKQDFTRRLRGYDPEEVQAFLHTLSAQWEAVLEDTRRLEERLREMETKLRHYERVEEALQEALKTARESARQAVQVAEQKAQQIRDDAEVEAERIKRSAEQDKHRLRQETQAILGRRKEIVARLRAFLLSEMEMLAHFEGEDPIGFIKLMPAEQQRRLAAMVEDEEGAFESAGAPGSATEPEPPEPDGEDHEESAAAPYFEPEPLAYDAYEASEPTADEPSGAAEPFSAPFSSHVAEQAHDERVQEEGAHQETMAERLLRLDQEDELEEQAPTPPREIWTDAAEEEPEAGSAPAPEPSEPAPAADASESDDQSTRPGWRQRSIIGSGGSRSPSETVSAAEEEIARIRRILSQLD